MCSSRLDISPCESLPLVSHCPLATTRIAADGNCFFWSVSLAVTGSQEFHAELRLLITMYMIHAQIKKSNVILSWIPRYVYGKLYETIKDADWATELEVIAAALLLLTHPFSYMQNVHGKHSNGLKHSPQETNTGLHQDEGICMNNFNKHF